MKILNTLRNYGNGTKYFHIFKQILACIAAGLIMLSAGMAYGFSGTLLPELVLDESIAYDRSYDSWVASVLPLSAIFACLIAGPIIDRFGRKRGLMITLIPLFLGWLLQAFAKSIVLLLIGRFLTGLCTGAVRPCALVYLGEIFDPKYRGTALFSMSLSMHLGVLICHWISNYVNWRTCCFVFISPPLISLLILIYLRESPMWYILNGRIDEGIEIFKWFRGDGEAADKELEEFMKKQVGKADITRKELLAFVFSKPFMKPFVTVVILFLSVQFLGLNNLSFYAEDIVRNTFSTDVDTFSMVMALDAIRVISSLAMCTIIDRLPRKLTFLSSSFVACIFILAIAVFLYVDLGLIWLHIVSMIGYVSFGSAVVSLSWSFLPEISPSKVRGFTSGLGAAINFLMLFASVNATPRLGQVYGQQAVFILHGTTTLLCTVFLCFLLPETKGKTLQEIEDTYVNNGKGDSTK